MRIIIILLIGGVLVFSYVKYLEKTAIFFPEKNLTSTPKEINIDFEDIYFTTSDDLKLNGWFIPNANAKHTIVFAHGNAGNISGRTDKIKLLKELNLNIFIFDYRGYGKSQGSPTETGIYTDTKAAYEWLTNIKGINKDSIIALGVSLGSAAAIDLASKVKLKALITEGAFTNAKDMARKLYPFLPGFIFGVKFDSINKIKTIEIPKLFIHSKTDEIVPFELSQRLYEAAKQPKTLLALNGTHNDSFLLQSGDYLKGIKDFIKSLD